MPKGRCNDPEVLEQRRLKQCERLKIQYQKNRESRLIYRKAQYLREKAAAATKEMQ